MIENILHKNDLYALVIRSDYKGNEVEFFTPDAYPLQMGYMKRERGYKIGRHKHTPVASSSVPGINQEVLLIKSGSIKVDLYDVEDQYISTVIVKEGDVIMFLKGGHGFEMLEPSDFIEIKQGPYTGHSEKITF